MVTGIAALFRAIWAKISRQTEAAAAPALLAAQSAAAPLDGAPAGLALASLSSLARAALPAVEPTVPACAPAFARADAAGETGARPPRDFRLSARLAATRSLNKPASRRLVAAERRSTSAAARKAKAVPPARHVWLATKPILPVGGGKVIPLPLPAERSRRMARAA